MYSLKVRNVKEAQPAISANDELRMHGILMLIWLYLLFLYNSRSMFLLASASIRVIFDCTISVKSFLLLLLQKHRVVLTISSTCLKKCFTVFSSLLCCSFDGDYTEIICKIQFFLKLMLLSATFRRHIMHDTYDISSQIMWKMNDFVVFIIDIDRKYK